jgi:cytoskeletal protein CcmA (bactofilin family)
MRQFRFVLLPILLQAAFLSPCLSAHAAIRAGEELFITAPVAKNAYLFAGRIVIIERLQADGVLAGGSIQVSAPVWRDLLAAGGEVLVNAPVGGNVRVAGGNVAVQGEVEGDLVAAGGRIIIAPDSRVAGDLLAAGGEVVVDGTIEGDLWAVGGRIIFNGEVAGRAHFRGSELRLNGRIAGPAEFSGVNVHLGPAAFFAGDVAYWQPEGAIHFGAALAPEADATVHEDLRFAAPRYSFGEAGRRAAIAWMALSFVSGAVLLTLLLLLAPGFTRLAGTRLAGSFWPKAGIGFLFFLATPPLALLLMISLIALPLGLFLAFLYLFALLFAVPLSAATLVRWLEARRSAQWSRGKLALLGLALLLVLKLLLFIPVVGWLLVAILVCAAYGALLTADWLLLSRGDRALS